MASSNDQRARPSGERAILGAVLGAAIGGVVLAAACGGSVDDPNYGPPSGLTGKKPSSVSVDGAAPAPTSTGTTDGGGTPSALCNGKGPIDGGACAISWKTNIYPKMQPAGAWKCSNTTSCHGGKNTGVTPLIDPTTAHTAYTQLVAYNSTANANKPYINPCSTNPATSTFACNVGASTPACGSLAMPSTAAPPGGAVLTTQEMADLLTWVKCGSPEN